LLFLNGAYAESVVVPARIVEKNLWRLKPTTAFRDAALAEPLGCAVQGAEDVHLHGGLRVLVLGSGPIGLMFVALAKHLACEVAVAGRGEKRLDTARRLKANHVIDVGNQAEVVAAVQSGAAGEFDVVIEAVGKPETWEAAAKLVRKGGRVNFFGGCPAGTTVRLDTERVHYCSLRLVSSFHHTPKTIRRALDYIEAGVIRADDFVDGECPISQLPELFQSMAMGNHAVKTSVRVHE
jgi:L-iditol 2-dehydrogenase